MAIDSAIKKALANVQLDDGIRDNLFNEIMTNITRDYGGTHIYIRERPIVNPECVRSFFNGRNLDECVRKFKIKKSRIYQIINRI